MAARKWGRAGEEDVQAVAAVPVDALVAAVEGFWSEPRLVLREGKGNLWLCHERLR